MPAITATLPHAASRGILPLVHTDQPSRVRRPLGLAALVGLVLLTGATAHAATPTGYVPQAMSRAPAGPALPTWMWQAAPAECLPEAPATAKEVLELEVKALTERMRREPEGSPAQLDIKVKIVGRLVASGDRFACKLGQQMLAKGLSPASAERTRCLLRRYCGAPAGVQCPAHTKLHPTEGCMPAELCGGEDLAARSALCVSTGHPSCCMSPLIIREYEQRKARVHERPESRAELLPWAERACDAGVAAACAQAAQLGSKRLDRRRRACELGHLESCSPIPKAMQ